MTHYMIRLKTILQYKYTTLIILLIVLLISFIRISIPYKTIIDINTKEVIGIITNIKETEDKIVITLKSDEKLMCTYYKKEEEKKKLKLGIKVKLTGEISLPNENTIPNTFNYKKYLNNQNIFYTMKVSSIEVINNNESTLYKSKNKLNNYIEKFKSKSYIYTFITGNKNDLNEETYKQYQTLGVSHIFAISGMHVSILAAIIFKLLYKLKDNTKYYIIISFLLFYAFITSYSASILRSISLYICLFINKRFNLYLKTINVYYIAIAILLIINPKLIFNIGFQYSVITSYALIKYNYLIKGNYIIKCLKISLIAFLFSLPITILNNYEINILSTLNNLIFVPLITFIIYPLTLLTLFLPFLDNIYLSLMNVVENISNNLFVLNIIIPKPNIVILIIYYITLHIFLISYQKKYLIILISLLLITKYNYLIDNNYYVYYLDVGQGDSSLLKYKNDVVLIDTGGNLNYSYADNLITFFKSIGITKIKYMVLTHGDYDHLGEAINIINKFNVENIILNCNDINDLELNIITTSKSNIYKCVKEVPLGKTKLQFINTQNYEDENNSSSVIYTKLYNTKLLFMGDAGIEVEEELIKNYNLSNIDIIKIGHHGSYTSTSKKFIDTIKPKYSIISVGKNNRYKHPHKSVLDNLKKTKIYRTDQNGSIIIKINKKVANFATHKKFI